MLLGLRLAASPTLHAQTIGELFASDASVRGSVVLSVNGTHVLSGSQVTAGDGVAVLKLQRGGGLRICPKTNLSLSVDPSGKALVLGMNAGSMELLYFLGAAVDSLITPDFRLQLISPGTFHLAISVAPSGDTCMRTLPGNDASVFVAEMMGGDSYQLSPGKNVLFRAGKISGAAEAPPVCGCPEMKAEPAAAAAPGKNLAPEAGLDTAVTPAVAEAATPKVGPPQVGANEALEAALKEAQSYVAEPHLEADSTFVYQGDEAGQDIYGSVARLSLSTDNSGLTLALLPQVKGPEAIPPLPEKKAGRLRRFGNFLRRLSRM